MVKESKPYIAHTLCPQLLHDHSDPLVSFKISANYILFILGIVPLSLRQNEQQVKLNMLENARVKKHSVPTSYQSVFNQILLQKMVLIRQAVLALSLIFSCFSQDLVVAQSNGTGATGGINSIDVDSEGTFWVGMNDNNVMRFDSNFTGMPGLTSTISPARRSWVSSPLPITLANGSSYTMAAEYMVIDSQDSLQVQMLNTTNQWILHTRNFGAMGPVLACFAFPYQSPTYTINSIMALLPDTIRMNYWTGTYNLVPSPSLPTTVISGILLKSLNTNSRDSLKTQVSFIFATDEPSIYQTDIEVRFTYNHVYDRFYYSSYTNNLTTLSATTSSMNFIEQAGDLIFLSSQTGSECYVHHIPTQTTTNIGPLVPGVSPTQFIYLNNDYYLMAQDGLYKLIYQPTANTLTVDYKTSPLPTGNHRVAISPDTTILYTQGSNTMYTRSTPSAQAAGSASLSIDSITSLSIPSWQGLLNFLVDVLKTGGSFFSGRRFLSPLFYFFGIYDDIFLYQFHDRNYGDTMTEVFEYLNSIEYAKWSFFNYKNVLQMLSIDSEKYEELSEYQSTYSTYQFNTLNHTLVGPQSLFANSHNFFLVSAPFSIIAFFVLRVAFKCTFHYRISTIFRKFDFLAFLMILLFDGNIEQFAFYMASEWKLLFFHKVSQKILKSLILWFGFLLVIGSVSFYLICFSLYRKLNRIIMDNNYNHLLGQVFLITQLCFKNFLLGILHSVLRALPYLTMLGLLVTIEVLFMLMFVLSVSQQVYKNRFKMWIYVLLVFQKILLCLSLYSDYQSVNNPKTQAVQQTIMFIQLLVFVFGMGTQSLCCALQIYSSLSSALASHRHLTKQARKKQINIRQAPRVVPQKQNKQVRHIRPPDLKSHKVLSPMSRNHPQQSMLERPVRDLSRREKQMYRWIQHHQHKQNKKQLKIKQARSLGAKSIDQDY